MKTKSNFPHARSVYLFTGVHLSSLQLGAFTNRSFTLESNNVAFGSLYQRLLTLKETGKLESNVYQSYCINLLDSVSYSELTIRIW